MWYIYVVSALALIAAAVLAARHVLIKRVFLRTDKRDMWSEGAKYTEEFAPGSAAVKNNYRQYEREIYEGRRWIYSMDPERVYIKSYDGLKLVGHYIDNPERKAVVLAVHGYRSCALNDFSCSAKYLYERGCSLLMIDMRAHGESEGNTITFGVKEKYDVRLWCEYLENRFPETPVLLIGVSMGAATVMMASGLDLPGCVRGIIADCGYTSPRAIYESVMSRFGRITPALVRTAEALAKRRVGFRFDDGDTRTELIKNKLPITIVHGTGDTFVPCSMSYENYEAAKQSGADCRLLTVENAEHALSFLTEKQKYLNEIDMMLEKCIVGNDKKRM